jgi:prepilin-type N-terminal cleavage/methylation domain-containing protein
MGRPRQSAAAQSGMTFIEIVVVLAVVGLMSVWGYPALLQMMNRVKLTTTARQTAISMQQARAEAVKRGFSTLVQYLDGPTCGLTSGKGCFITYADTDGDRVFTDGTDVLLGGRYSPPVGIDLWGPADSAAEGADAIVGFTATDGPVFNTDGSVQTAGAFRLRDAAGNFLEVRVEFKGTGKVVTQKWFGGSNWYENGEGGNVWTW